MGIMVPRVNTAEEARSVVQHAKYPPLGQRGFGARGVITDYEAVTVPQVIDWVNENTLVIVQVESGEAVAQLEQTSRIPGIDVAMIGPNDLSISLGVPGDFEHPKFLKAVEQTFEICLKNGIAPGVHTPNLQAVKRYRDMGMCFLMYSTEARMLLDAATKAVHELVGETGNVGKAVY